MNCPDVSKSKQDSIGSETESAETQSEVIRLLIVDDVELNRNYLRNLIARYLPEARIEEADCGRTALELAQASPPDIMVLDVKMPDMDGYAVCRQVKADPRTSAVLVLMVSGYMTDVKSRISGLQSGADSYLCKPFESEEMIAQLIALKRIHHAAAR